MVDPIRVDEWLAEVNRLTRNNADGFSVRDVAEATGHTHEWARNRIKEAMSAGLVVYSGRRSGIRMDGASSKIPVYRAETPFKKKPRKP